MQKGTAWVPTGGRTPCLRVQPREGRPAHFHGRRASRWQVDLYREARNHYLVMLTTNSCTAEYDSGSTVAPELWVCWVDGDPLLPLLSCREFPWRQVLLQFIPSPGLPIQAHGKE